MLQSTTPALKRHRNIYQNQRTDIFSSLDKYVLYRWERSATKFLLLHCYNRRNLHRRVLLSEDGFQPWSWAALSFQTIVIWFRVEAILNITVSQRPSVTGLMWSKYTLSSRLVNLTVRCEEVIVSPDEAAVRIISKLVPANLQQWHVHMSHLTVTCYHSWRLCWTLEELQVLTSFCFSPGLCAEVFLWLNLWLKTLIKMKLQLNC